MAHVSTTTGSVVRSLIAAGHAPEDADWAAVVRFALRTAAKAQSGAFVPHLRRNDPVTIVVYRDGVIASDSAIHLGNTRLGSVRKIARGPDGSLGGAAGDANSLAKFIDWIRDGEREPFGQLGGDLYPDALIVRPSGAMFYTGHLGTPYRVTGVPWLLVGCGATVALGALHMGATAKEAVKAAIRWDSGCAGDIQILTLGKPKR